MRTDTTGLVLTGVYRQLVLTELKKNSEAKLMDRAKTFELAKNTKKTKPSSSNGSDSNSNTWKEYKISQRP
uniref:Uncharacterized protein n=1 Tax=Steinernema glaseri TaxID=37863 RepID=A0A1I7YU69_9BILA